MTAPEITPPLPETLDAIRAGDAEKMRKVLARTWLEQQGDTSLPHAVEGSRVRHSWAASCARALHYKIARVPESNPPDVAAQWVFRLGHLVHDEWQLALQNAFPGTQIEVGHPNPEVSGSFTLDAEMKWTGPDQADDDPEPNGEVQVVEIKSIGGFGFKMMNGARGKDGPRHSALLQLALNATRTPGCTGGWMIYAAMENTSVNESKRHDLGVLDRFLLVNYYPIDRLRPLAELEEARMRQVLEDVDAGRCTPRAIPDPELPPGALISDPTKGAWQVYDQAGQVVDTGTHWSCAYCSYQTKCIEDGPC